MKRSPMPTVGTTGPRRPLPHIRPLSYARARVRDLRAFPIQHNPRLRVLDYRLTTAPGMTGRPRTHGHGSARIAGGYVLSLALTRECGEWYLETEARCYDEQAAQREGIVWGDQLLADLFRAVQSRHLAAEGMAHGRGAGRN